MGTRLGSKSGCGSVTATWWRTPPTGIRMPASAPIARELRAAGQHDPVGGDRTG